MSFRDIVEMAVDHFNMHRFAYGIIVGLFLYQPLFYFLFGVRMIMWGIGVK